MTFDALGHTFTIEGRDDVAELFRELRRDGIAAQHRYVLETDRLWCDDDGVGIRVRPELLVARLLWHINRGAIAASSPHRTLLHASAAATPDGDAIVLPAARDSGKSTLVAALVQHGWAYVTDEVVSLTPDTLLIDPYPKPVAIDAAYFVPEAVVDTQTRPRWLVFPAYEPGAPTELTPIPPEVASALLVQHSFNAAESPDRWGPVLEAVARAGESFTLTARDADTALAALNAITGRSSRAT